MLIKYRHSYLSLSPDLEKLRGLGSSGKSRKVCQSDQFWAQGSCGWKAKPLAVFGEESNNGPESEALIQARLSPMWVKLSNCLWIGLLNNTGVEFSSLLGKCGLSG